MVVTVHLMRRVEVVEHHVAEDEQEEDVRQLVCEKSVVETCVRNGRLTKW